MNFIDQSYEYSCYWLLVVAQTWGWKFFLRKLNADYCWLVDSQVSIEVSQHRPCSEKEPMNNT